MTATRRRSETNQPTSTIIDVGAALDREAGTRTDTERPPPVAKKRSTSDGVKAGQIYQALADLDAEEAAALAASPEEIRARFAAKRSKETAGVSENVLALVERMRGGQ